MPGSTFLMLRRPELSLLGMSETFILLRFSHFLPLVFSEMRGGISTRLLLDSSFSLLQLQVNHWY